MDLVERPHGRNEPWDQMTKQAARDLAAGKPTGRIGYYRPRITIKDYDLLDRRRRVHLSQTQRRTGGAQD